MHETRLELSLGTTSEQETATVRDGVALGAYCGGLLGVSRLDALHTRGFDGVVSSGKFMRVFNSSTIFDFLTISPTIFCLCCWFSSLAIRPQL